MSEDFLSNFDSAVEPKFLAVWVKLDAVSITGETFSLESVTVFSTELFAESTTVCKPEYRPSQ